MVGWTLRIGTIFFKKIPVPYLSKDVWLPLSPKFPTVALQRSKLSESVHGGGRIQTPGTCAFKYTLYISIYVTVDITIQCNDIMCKWKSSELGYLIGNNFKVIVFCYFLINIYIMWYGRQMNSHEEYLSVLFICKLIYSFPVLWWCKK